MKKLMYNVEFDQMGILIKRHGMWLIDIGFVTGNRAYTPKWIEIGVL
jgi:hypothetical protein